MMVLLLCLSFAASMLLIMLAAIWMLRRMVISCVEQRHRAAEVIINHKQAPKSWTRRLLKNMRSNPPAAINSLGEKAKARCLIRLTALIRYFENCPYLEDDESREVLLRELQEIHALWKDKHWREIVEERPASWSDEHSDWVTAADGFRASES